MELRHVVTASVNDSPESPHEKNSGFFFWSFTFPVRAGYLREATRFKATRDSIDVPSRDQQVIDNAPASAVALVLHLP